MVEASHEDAAADADSVGAVDDHGVALDAALRIVRADGERDFPDLQARVDVHRRGFALVSAGVSGAVRASPRVVYADAARRHGGFVVVAALAGVVVAGSAGVDVRVDLSVTGVQSETVSSVGALARRIASRAARPALWHQ